MRAIEATGILDTQGHLQLKTSLPQGKPSRVRIILLLPDEHDAELGEKIWVKAIATHPSFAFLHDPKQTSTLSKMEIQ